MTKLSTRALGASSYIEEELILYSARTCLSAETAGHVRALLREQLDWPALIQTASDHGVVPLLYRALSTTAPDLTPASALNHLRLCFTATEMRNRFMAEELFHLLDLLSSQSISAIPLKGPALAVSAYGDLGLRPFADLDILLHPEDVPRACDILLQHGYHRSTSKAACDVDSLMRDQTEKDVVFRRNDSLVITEFHWALLPVKCNFNIDLEQIWRRSQQVSLLGRSVRSLSLEDQILFLCVHGAKHGWQRLSWICDVAELVRAWPEMKWGQVIAQARMVRCERMLFLGLYLAAEVLEASIPEDVWREVQRERKVVPLAAEVLAGLRGGRRAHQDLKGWIFWLKARDVVWDGVPFMVHRVFTPTHADRVVWELPTSLSFLYYLIRPLRLLRERVRARYLFRRKYRKAISPTE